jgi:hypothetical protein
VNTNSVASATGASAQAAPAARCRAAASGPPSWDDQRVAHLDQVRRYAVWRPMVPNPMHPTFHDFAPSMMVRAMRTAVMPLIPMEIFIAHGLPGV